MNFAIRTMVVALLAGCTGEVVSNDNGPRQVSGGAGASAGARSTQTGAGAAAGGNAGAANGTPGASGGAAQSGGTVGMTAGAGAGTVGAAGAGTPAALNLSGSPQYYRLVRLTNDQWARSVQDVLKLATPSGLDANFQAPVSGTTDFTNNELVLDVNQRSWSDFQSAAEALAAKVTASSAALASVYAGTDAAGLISTLGRRVYRRPLTDAEKAAYQTLFDSGATLSGTNSAFVKGAGLVIRAMLQSPNFLYRTELGGTGSPLSAYEIAAKLSLWLRGTTPSDALLDSAAGSAKLDTADGAATLATSLVEEQTANAVMHDFYNELLHFDRYSTVSKIGVSGYDATLNSEYLETSYRFFDKIFSAGLGVKEILTSTSGFVGPRMAALYGVQAPASGFEERDLGAQRVGYFSQIPFLSLYALNADPDPIHRGVSLNLDVLCSVLGPPAANIPPVPPLQPGQTNRQRITTLTTPCGGSCHAEQINPLGFAFEHFDGMGRYRDVENGNLSIDSSGSFNFTEGAQSFAGAAELMREMAAGKQAHTCYAKKLSSFALQRDIVASDLPLLDTLSQVSLQSDSIKRLIVELVRNDAFRVRSKGNP